MNIIISLHIIKKMYSECIEQKMEIRVISFKDQNFNIE